MRLNRDIRYQISALLTAGHQQKVIAKLVGISEGGLSKENSRNGGRKKYDPDKADKRAVKLQHKAHIHYEYSDEVWAETEALIKEDLSPEQAVGRRGLEGKISPSVPTIYRHIKGRDEFKPHLRHGNKKYRERGPAKDGRGSITGQVPIDLRPAIVDEKSRFGDFEIDLINGAHHKGNLLTDNGKEFADHVRIAQKLDVGYYFAHPYHLWERGANENMNGLIRQYLPKGTSFEDLTREEVKWIEWKLNNRPRKRLGFLTPLEYISRQVKQIYLAT